MGSDLRTDLSSLLLPLPGALDGITSSASRLIQQAASILEDELSAGISAAQRVERRVFDSSRRTDKESDADLVVRFRRDAHQVVDILIDLVDGATERVASATRRAVNIRPGGAATQSRPKPKPAPAARPAPSDIPTLAVPDRVAPGKRGEVTMSVENDAETPTEPFQLVSSGLVSAAGNHLGPDALTFDPPTLTLSARSARVVKVAVDVPESTEAGTYSGLIQATKLDRVRAVLLVDVG